MPKIIENVRRQLIDVARRQLSDRGYSGMTVRSVAGDCGLATGTVYNYFSSKDVLVATVMSEDWLAALAAIDREKTDSDEILYSLHTAIIDFCRKYSLVFSDSEAANTFITTFGKRHGIMLGQIADIILPFCEGKADERKFSALFAAEALISWSSRGESFGKIVIQINKIIKN